MSKLVTTRVREHATRLGLTHLAEHLPELLNRADTNKLGYLEFLDLVTGEEAATRDGRRFTHTLKLAGLPHHKTLQEFQFSFQPDLDVRKVRDLATLAFIETHTNVALLGPPGVGKTHLACSLAVAACQAGHSVYFTSLDDMAPQATRRRDRRRPGPPTTHLPTTHPPAHRRGWLPGAGPRRRQPRLPGGITPIREGIDHHHQQ